MKRVYTDTSDKVWFASVIAVVLDYAFFGLVDSTVRGIARADIIFFLIFVIYLSVSAKVMGGLGWFLNLFKGRLAAVIFLLFFLALLSVKAVSDLLVNQYFVVSSPRIGSSSFLNSMIFLPFMLTLIHTTSVKQFRWKFRPWRMPKGKIWWIGVTMALTLITLGFLGVINDSLYLALGILILSYAVSRAIENPTESGKSVWGS